MPKAKPLPPIDNPHQVQTITLDMGDGNYIADGVYLVGTPEIEITVKLGEDPNPQSHIVRGPEIGTAPKPYGSGRENLAILFEYGPCPATVTTYLIQGWCDQSDGDVATIDVELPVRLPT